MLSTMLALSIQFTPVPSVADTVGRLCGGLPMQVQHAILKMRGWKLVELSDLPADDRALWVSNHQNSCPGFSSADQKNGRSLIGVALIRRSPSGPTEEILLIMQRSSSGVSIRLRVGPQRVISPFVTWAARPGAFEDRFTGNSVKISDYSIIYEKMEASSTQFCFQGGAIKRLVAAD